MRNILYASHTPALKGSAVSLTQLVLGLDREVYRPTVIFSKDGPLAMELSRRGVSTHILSRKGWLGCRLVRDVLSVLDSERIQIVHLNSAVPFCKYVGLAARLRKLPVLWHIREDPTGSRVRRLRKWIGRLSDRILVVSSELEEAFRGDGRAVRIYNGVDVRDFHPERDGGDFRDRHGIARDAFVFGIVGTIEERKGTTMFLEAARRMIEDGREAVFLVVGDGLPEEERKVRDLLRSQGPLASRVVLTGRLSNIPEVMAALDVLVVPSLWEGFPRSVLEAMASGRPVIATNVGEVPWMVEEGRTGWVIPRKDPVALYRSMCAALDDREALAKVGLAARRKAEAEYSLERHVKAVCDQYQEVLAGRDGGLRSSALE